MAEVNVLIDELSSMSLSLAHTASQLVHWILSPPKFVIANVCLLKPGEDKPYTFERRDFFVLLEEGQHITGIITSIFIVSLYRSQMTGVTT